MKKTKLQKLTSIKKNLENRIKKINNEPFFSAISIALKNDWAGTKDEQKYWHELLKKARDGNEDALIQLRSEFKFNLAFKKETARFANV